MKKFILSGLILLGLSSSLLAQKTVTLGLHAGLNISTFDETVTYNNGSIGNGSEKSKVGFSGGADVSFALGHKGWYLQSGLNYTQGGINAGKDESTGYDTKMSLSYLTLPVLGKYVIKKIGLGFMLGVEYGYLLTATASESNGNANVSASAKDFFNSSQFSLVWGVEYYMKNGIGFNVALSEGLTNILSNTSLLGVQDARDISVRNHILTIGAGYRF
jgi:hypothetical protein